MAMPYVPLLDQFGAGDGMQRNELLEEILLGHIMTALLIYHSVQEGSINALFNFQSSGLEMEGQFVVCGGAIDVEGNHAR